MMLLVWRYLLHRRPQPVTVVEEPDDYGTHVAPTRKVLECVHYE